MLFNCISHHWPVVKDKRLLRVSSESWQLILGVVLCTVAIVNLAYSGIFCRLDWEQESVQEVESLWTLQECSGNIILLGGGRYRGMCFSLEWVSLKLWAHDSVVFPASFQWYIHAGHQRFPDTKEEVSNSLKRWHSLDKLWGKKNLCNCYCFLNLHILAGKPSSIYMTCPPWAPDTGVLLTCKHYLVTSGTFHGSTGQERTQHQSVPFFTHAVFHATVHPNWFQILLQAVLCSYLSFVTVLCCCGTGSETIAVTCSLRFFIYIALLILFTSNLLGTWFAYKGINRSQYK